MSSLKLYGNTSRIEPMEYQGLAGTKGVDENNEADLYIVLTSWY